MTRIQQEVKSLSRDELNIVSRKLNIKSYRKKTREELEQLLLSTIEPSTLSAALKISWWAKYHNHVYGAATLIGLILSMAMFLIPKIQLLQNITINGNTEKHVNPNGQLNAQLEVRIDEIIPNSEIRGRVSGFTASQSNRYKILVYVKTDKWYIFPFDNGGEGLSYAKIHNNGLWRIKSISRKVPPTRIAALIVENDYYPPKVILDHPSTDSDLIRRVDAVAYYIMNIEGRL